MRIGWQFVVDSCRLFYHFLVLCRLHTFGTKFDPKVLMSIALKKQKVKQTSLELKDQCWYNLRHFSCPYTNVVLMLSTLTKSNAQLAELPFKFSCGILSDSEILSQLTILGCVQQIQLFHFFWRNVCNVILHNQNFQTQEDTFLIRSQRGLKFQFHINTKTTR